MKIKLLYYFKINPLLKFPVTQNYWWFNYSYTCWISTIFNSLRRKVLRLWRILKIKIYIHILISNFLTYKMMWLRIRTSQHFHSATAWRSEPPNSRKHTRAVILCTQHFSNVKSKGWYLNVYLICLKRWFRLIVKIIFNPN